MNAKNPLPKVKERANLDVNKWGGLETRGYKPKPGERATTKEQYKAQEQKTREVLREKANVSSYPPRTRKTSAEAQNVVGELNNILGDGKRAPNPVVSVITHRDGTVSVGISGEASPKNIETARQLQNALNKKYGDKYTVKAEPMPTENLYTIEGSNTAGTCAESKVVNAAHDNPSKITGMVLFGAHLKKKSVSICRKFKPNESMFNV
ncbi:hypothetical protein PAALTS15_18953 [Paenibacillus alvei TS-15]|uniref:Uncharacterized protein n=1 Tax=Paenibacillus alvei TS-15 TaxID=1117108 RepID=S9SIM5_PAEAL|nr:hypothetical protein [Paenibacillus alvei]EPY05637.1 hypothetical protein PAALTS15_18953 [Paenibacillus alvei TS-15]